MDRKLVEFGAMITGISLIAFAMTYLSVKDRPPFAVVDIVLVFGLGVWFWRNVVRR